MKKERTPKRQRRPLRMSLLKMLIRAALQRQQKLKKLKLLKKQKNPEKLKLKRTLLKQKKQQKNQRKLKLRRRILRKNLLILQLR